MATNDNFIVPGQRIGRVFLGMSTVQLYRAMGEPKESTTFNDGSSGYSWKDLWVVADRTGKVVWTQAQGPRYSLADGLTVGASLLAFQAQLLIPTRRKQMRQVGTATVM